MKRSITFALAMTMALSMGACGNSEGTAAEGSQDTSRAAEALGNTGEETDKAGSAEGNSAGEDEDTASIVVAYYCNGSNTSDVDAVEEAINAITVEAINTEVELMPFQSGSYNEQMNLMISSNEQLDLAPTFFAGPTTFAAMTSQKQLTPLDDLLNEYGQDILSEIKPEYMETTKLNGVTYAVPVNKDMVSNMYLAMRTDILEQLGMLEKGENLTSMSELTEILAAVKEQTELVPMAPAGSQGNVTTFMPVLVSDKFEDAVTFDKLINDYIVAFTDEPAKVVNLFETEEYKAALQVVRDWYEAGYVYKDAATTEDNNYMFVKNDIAFAYFFAAENSTYMDTVAQSGYDMTVIKIASAPVSTSTVNAIDWTIPVTTREPEAAMKFLNLMYSNKEIVDLLNYGIEETHYVVQEDGTYNFPEGVDSNNAGYYINMTWEICNQYLAGLWDGSNPDTREISAKDNENPLLSPLIGFVADSTGLENEITAVTAVYNEYYKGLNCGILDLETELPAFNEKLKGAGIDKMVDSAQAQLDEWYASKDGN